jgi:non-canonical purine NTP pyrophosphatase (RdgB/HAM1 family)
MKKNIVFITGNENKRKEVEDILGNDKCEVINIKLDLPEIQSINVEEVIKEKIKYAYHAAEEKIDEIKKKFNKKNIIINSINDVIIVCEDTGLYIKDMNNFPGALIKFYLESIGPSGIIKINHGSKAYVICAIGMIKNGKIQKLIVGKKTGTIANELSGNESFGWDPVFIPDLEKTKYSKLQGKTYAELSKNIKNEISHRSIAFNKLKNKL